MEDSGRPDPFCWVRIQIWKLEGQVQEIYFINGIGRANHDIDENQQDDQDYARYEGSGTKQMGLVLEGVSLHDRCRYFLLTANAMITISFVIAIMITFSGEWALQVRDATETRWATAFFEVQRKVIFNAWVIIVTIVIIMSLMIETLAPLELDPMIEWLAE